MRRPLQMAEQPLALARPIGTDRVKQVGEGAHLAPPRYLSAARIRAGYVHGGKDPPLAADRFLDLPLPGRSRIMRRRILVIGHQVARRLHQHSSV